MPRNVRNDVPHFGTAEKLEASDPLCNLPNGDPSQSVEAPCDDSVGESTG